MAINGKIGVSTENIFPIIKKFLYSDHDIFIRELVSNAVDACQKIKVLTSIGEATGELGELKVEIQFDQENKTISIIDNGVGMTSQEIEKFINQIAFSGAEEFLEKHKDKTNIIGHFGLGFYSSFMVASKVEIITKSYKDEPAMHWECDGSPEYSLNETTREGRGTSIILHIADDSEEFLDKTKIKGLLEKYCKFLPVPVIFGKEQEWKDGAYVDTDKVLQINDTNPLWTRTPSELTEEDYNKFYHDLYPMSDDPLFHIHLNVDYPFTLTGTLYFPKISTNLDFQKNKIQLYCNQVFVTDSVEGIVPEFLTLLHGVIDSPDIPLNVSRSYLQSDGNVKKIAGHISKKVSDRLQEIFKSDRAQFESKWDSLKLFISYGMISEPKFYERAQSFGLFKNTDGKYFTFDEYKTLIAANQTDKNNNLIYLYASNTDSQYSFINAAKEKGYDVLVLDGHLDAHLINKLEESWKDCRFVRVDGDVVDKLIEKDVVRTSKLTTVQQDNLRPVFETNLPEGSAKLFVAFEALDETDAPVLITQNEFMRRMKDMSAISGQSAMYGNMGDMLNLVVNANHPLVNKVLTQLDGAVGTDLTQCIAKIEEKTKETEGLHAQTKDMKEDEVPQALRDQVIAADKELDALKKDRKALSETFGKSNDLSKQLIDLALLANNRLKGEALDRFVKRSISLVMTEK